MRFGKEELKDFDTAISREYLITNGIGGYCNSTICGANIRKYNALLVAATNPPVDRRVLLSKLDETVFLDNKEYVIYSNENMEQIIDEGYKYEISFENSPFPKQNFVVDGVFISKKITMKYGQNITVVNYSIRNNNKSFKMRIQALINNRDHHANTKLGGFKCKQEVCDNGTDISFDINSLKLYLKSDKARYKRDEEWYMGMYYDNENGRGLDDFDNHFIPGYFELSLNPYETAEFSIIASTESIDEVDGRKYFEDELERKRSILGKLQFRDELSEMLALAADQFLVKRKSTATATVIAGYPWFTDWGRDTMIALPGLTLCTGRFEEAKELLLTFSKYVKDGLVPNMFPDTDVEPIYNTIDASLWYFNAVYQYLKYTNDYEFIRNNIFQTLTAIMNYHIKGTKYDIGMDPKDGLLKGGNKDTQLTWMDVKIEGFAVTPRHGKAVEINALWYNAVCIYKKLCEKFNINYEFYDQLIYKIKENFIKKFWNDNKNYFYDYIDGDICNDQIRPNGIIALSLPYCMVDKDMAKRVISVALEKLYTPYGLRSLALDDKQYTGRYSGNLLERDLAYHQGTVWAWLIGPFISAVKKWCKDDELCNKLIEPFYDHLRDCCIGTISEVFDGDAPYKPKACYAQAWSVAEVLRVYLEVKGVTQ